MNNAQNPSDDSFRALRNIEAELFERAPGSTAEPRPAAGRDSWQLNREVLDLHRKCADLKDELEAARTLLTEQNVLAASSLSALREVGRDLERAREDLRKQEEEKLELRRELEQEKNRRESLREQLARENAHREEISDLLRGAVRAEAPEQQRPAAPLPAPERPGRFVRRFF
ncbi:MAG TPA: hypothetical protein DCW72_00485 [Elusimicrobia bacterium]|nr:MAG: hypothetical protein A2X29_10205 [Elusimicrobia bacterium GWA2_64_40]OGR67960.1 MAG: hypothetical protein A2X30_03200 [Elusimicrobia bacterium GWB2_63_16]HAN04506.1 hypothetical protein [Elusimicrobiota bacterium]HAU88750.1 hypothetical protein [Elusimicrobiota bacterium]